jgi:serine/threonine-protein kinase
LTTRPDGSPCIKVLDFGISKMALTDLGADITQAAMMMGSPNYMAPEQIRSARDVDARADLWSLGIILHELLAGDVAFKADTVPELYVAILQSPPIRLRSVRPDIPPAIEALILRCLEKDPARRFRDVAELGSALFAFAPPDGRLSVERICRIVGAPCPRIAEPQGNTAGARPTNGVSRRHRRVQQHQRLPATMTHRTLSNASRPFLSELAHRAPAPHPQPSA